MKKLNKFLKFDFKNFVNGKTFEIVEVKSHFVYENGEKKDADGVIVRIAITTDNTDYGENDVTNKFEQFNVKCIGADLEKAKEKFHVGNLLKFKKYKKATVYGTYRNQLSVEVGSLDDMEAVTNE